MIDLIIIGGGPAGISASLYTTRAKLNTVIIDNNKSALLKAHRIENYYGFSEAISGVELITEGIKQTKNLGTKFIEDEVLSITQNYDSKIPEYIVKTKNGVYLTNILLIATGQPVVKVKIKGFNEFFGKGISSCVTCDGFFYRNKKVGVLGNKDFAMHEALELETYTKDITIYTNGLEPHFSEEFKQYEDKFEINTQVVSEIEGDEVIKSLVFENGIKEEIDGLFVALDTASGINFAQTLGVATNNNSIVVDNNFSTNLPGVYAAGDCTGIFKQISVAVGQGAIAARSIIDYKKKINK